MVAAGSGLPVPAEATTAQTIVARNKAKARRQNITGELATLSDKFTSIYTEVQAGVTKEYETQEDRLQGVEDHITRLQYALLKEQHKRVDMLKTVESNLTQQCDAVQAQCHAQLDALRPEIPERLAAWHKRLDTAFVLLAEETVARRIVIERERLKLLKTVDDFEQQLEMEKVRGHRTGRHDSSGRRAPHRTSRPHTGRHARRPPTPRRVHGSSPGVGACCGVLLAPRGALVASL